MSDTPLSLLREVMRKLRPDAFDGIGAGPASDPYSLDNRIAKCLAESEKAIDGELNLDQLEQIGKAATAAPWRESDEIRWIMSGEDDVAPIEIFYEQSGMSDADAVFVIAARNHWQAMIDEIRDLRARIEDMESRGWERSEQK